MSIKSPLTPLFPKRGIEKPCHIDGLNYYDFLNKMEEVYVLGSGKRMH
jgi:hypothetical protein